MMASLYIGATGLKGHGEGMNVITNNLANVNTVGYKQQSLLFSDLISTTQAGMGGWWGAEQNSYVAMGQLGKGVQVDSVRTLFTQGGHEMGIDVTDLSIGGKGFFQVTTPDGNLRYTRAGNFRFDKNGFLTLPGGEKLTGIPINPDGTKGTPASVRLDPNSTFPAKATSSMTLSLNLGIAESHYENSTDPYFGMALAFNPNGVPPLTSDSYAYTQQMRVYDAQGIAHTVTLYVDGTQTLQDGKKTLQYLMTAPQQTPATGTQALVSGTLTFTGSGQLTDMTAFSFNGTDPNDLTQWTPTPQQNGVPTFTLNGQSVALDFGIQGTWSNAPANASLVGKDPTLLPTMGTSATRSSMATTAYAGTSSQKNYIQNGYSTGFMTDLDIRTDGSVVASYSNGQSQKLYEIPICRFTSEDGLRREGHNLFAATPDAGAMEMGRAGTENYGQIYANSLETSNVDMAREMVNMIVVQRGFQSNSKVITTADTMLQRALELKRA